MPSPLPPELQRAELLADQLHKAVRVAEAVHADRVCFQIEEARELVQLLNDSIKTAKQLLGQDKKGLVRRA
jgi:hypothetical protein